jgi:ATP-dependent Clp protease ATP-binding subunit ClpX
MDVSPFSKAVSVRSGLPKKLQQKFSNRYRPPCDRKTENTFLTRALPNNGVSDNSSALSRLPQSLATAAATFTIPADGTIPLLRMKSNFAAKVMSQAQIKDRLKAHIVGQDDAMDEMAMLGYQILLEKAHVESDSSWRFRAPHKLVFGGTGTGKTYSVRKLAEILDIPFIEVNAPALVNEGIVGTSLSAAYVPLKKAMDVEKFAIIFLDEMGKMCATHWGDAVMRILLGHMNGTDVQLPRDNAAVVNTSCFTYIGADACSAFGKPISEITVEDLTGPAFRMTPELLGRFTGIIRLAPHTESSLLRILKNAQDGPYNHARESFKRAFESETGQKVELEIADSGLLAISRHAFKHAEGARILEEVFSKVINPLVTDPNSFIQRFNAFKRAEKEADAINPSIVLDTEDSSTVVRLKPKKKDSIGYRLEFSGDGSTIKWIIDSEFVEENLPIMIAKEDTNSAWRSMFA